MNTDERTATNIKLAEILGARWEPVGNAEKDDGLYGPVSARPLALRAKGGQLRYQGPNFCESIDAQAPLVKLVEARGLWNDWVESVERQLEERGEPTTKWDIAHASPEIRAAAFLEVLS